MVVFWYNDEVNVGRVVARQGDVVDIDAHGLRVNGSLVTEPFITVETTQVKDAVAVMLIGDITSSSVSSSGITKPGNL